MSATDRARRAGCPCLCHESGPPDLHMAPGLPCPCKVDPHRGMRFAHARMRQALPGLRIDEQPAEVCRVTRVTATTIYYRTGDGQHTLYVSARARFAEKIGELLPDA